MKKVVHNNIAAPYSLHDMSITAFEIKEDCLTMISDTGMVNGMPPYKQVNGHVEFYKVQWNFSFVYLLNHTGNVGKFNGEKMYLNDFIEKYPVFGFNIIDETFGYNQTKYSGFLLKNHEFYECIIEIYHEGNSVYVEDEDK